MKALSEDEVLEAVYNNTPISKIYSPEIKDRYNTISKLLDLEEMVDKPVFTNDWLMPEEYKSIDLVEYFSDKVNTEEQALRVAKELDLFIQTKNEDLLRYLIYLSDVIKENNIVVGIGRGSSVSLYTLYLIGIHKVDSLFHDLSPTDFFKIK